MFAATFPGQGSQSIGMLSDLSRACAEVRDTFDEASHALGYDLWKLVQEGPERRLSSTEHTQPAMLAAGVAAWRCWTARGGPRPGVAAGHSLGEYSALVAFGALDFADAIRVVSARGRFMQEAVPRGEGGIAAIIGLDDDTVAGLCAGVREEAGLGHVSAVNFNAPGQVAVAGASRAIDRAIEGGARGRGQTGDPPSDERPGALPADGPRHRAIGGDAGRRSHRAAHRAGAAQRGHHEPPDGDSIRSALSRQLASPVRWRHTVIAMRERGAATMVEFGPGRVLTGLARRIDRGIAALAVHDAKSLGVALETVAKQADG